MWRTSVLCNGSIDFFLFTDQDIASEKNLHVVNTTFGEFAKMIQKRLDFGIACAHPYKLCDYKPAYGLVFKDLLARPTTSGDIARHGHGVWRHQEVHQR